MKKPLKLLLMILLGIGGICGSPRKLDNLTSRITDDTLLAVLM